MNETPVILIVEDDHELREMLRLSLTRRKFTVIEAGNGKEAIAHFKPSVTDLVIVDLIMPEEDGLKVIMRMKQIKPEIKIIAISGGGKAGPANYLQLARTLGADEAYPKPFSLHDLISRIETMLDNQNI
mgnify:CR=1 FL=1